MLANKAHIIVVGNEKGGTGKSTISMHLIVNLLKDGFKVASIDLDGRQGSLSKFIQNRARYIEKHDVFLPLPEHICAMPANLTSAEECRQDIEQLEAKIEELSREYDVIVIDTPGSYNHLFLAGHEYADTLVTPINDSLVDLDVLAQINPDTLKVEAPSHYAELVWDIRKKRATKGKPQMRWIVLRNRLAHLKTRNKGNTEKILDELSKKVGFFMLKGVGERVIYKELYLQGLTVLDLDEDSEVKIPMSMSHVSARQEIRRLVSGIGLDKLVLNRAS